MNAIIIRFQLILKKNNTHNKQKYSYSQFIKIVP